MIIRVKVKPGARAEKIEILTPDTLRIAVPAPAENNRANHALIKMLSRFLKIPPSDIIIARGRNSRQKLIELVGIDRLPVAPNSQQVLL
jgi:uncharacterized protein